MMIKKIFSSVLSVALALSLCACQNGGETFNSSDGSSRGISVVSDTSVESVGGNAESSVGPSSTVSVPDESVGDNSEGSVGSSSETNVPEEKNVIGDISAMELTAKMKIGWNIGNTLDATGAGGLSAETSWGNQKLTKENIDAVKAAGFNVLRVPVSWGKHLDENYNIDGSWMDRVQEVVDYGIDNDMFVILNTHHEEWYFPSAEHVEHDLKELEAVWKQIAERFESYGERLIFEGLNEPRLRGDSLEWSGNDSARDIVNRYAETFVKTVRATGGNNADRILMVTPYSASSDERNLRALKIPEDSGKIIVSVHAYLPYSFALDTKGTSEYNPENNTDLQSFFDTLKRVFIDNDIPVIIGEFGAVNKENPDDRLVWVRSFLALAKQNGIPCVWWDNGQKSGSGENFALLNRADNTWHFPELVDAIRGAVY